jgi:hypothetical protein
MKIEVKKPQYLDAKAAAKPAVKEVKEPGPKGLPGFYKFLLLLSYAGFGYAIWVASQFFIKK